MFKAPRTKDTTDFYDQLLDGDVKRSLWGPDSRFGPDKIANSASTHLHYLPTVKALCKPQHKALDIGCSTGGFTSILAQYCEDVTGVDLSSRAVGIANQFFQQKNLSNCRSFVEDGASLDYDALSFDIIQLIDVIHHTEDPIQTLGEVARLLKEDGRVIIFEPNKYNLALFVMCLLDKNEWGALRFGSIRQYRKLLEKIFIIECIEYNGLLVGPGSPTALKIANFLLKDSVPGILATQSPKIKIVLKKKPLHNTST